MALNESLELQKCNLHAKWVDVGLRVNVAVVAHVLVFAVSSESCCQARFKGAGALAYFDGTCVPNGH
jgi:hypothetical protein